MMMMMMMMIVINSIIPPANEQMNKTLNIAGCISQIRWLCVMNGWFYYLLMLGTQH